MHLNRHSQIAVPMSIDSLLPMHQEIHAYPSQVGRMGMQAIGHGSALAPLHRLDCGTEGVVVLGKTKAFGQRFSKLMRREPQGSSEAGDSDDGGCTPAGRGVSKTYRALSAHAAPVGLLEQFCVTNFRIAPGPDFTRVAREEVPGSVDCRLRVEKVRRRAVGRVLGMRAWAAVRGLLRAMHSVNRRNDLVRRAG